MTITSVRLVDGAAEMILFPRTDLRLLTMDVPLPSARAVTEPRTDDDGEHDDTQHHDGSSCSLEIRVLTTPATIKDELARFQYPGDRPYLCVIDDEWGGERRLRLRADAGDGKVGTDLPPNMRDLRAQWRVPDGTWEDVDEVTTNIPVDTVSTTGLAVPVVIPATMAAGSSAGALLVVNSGPVPLHWRARLYGPCTGPKLTLDETGAAIVFKSSMVLGAGEYLDVDSRLRTVWLLSDTSNSRLGEVDYTLTTWWRLARGDNHVRYNPASGVVAGAMAELYTRTQWI